MIYLKSPKSSDLLKKQKNSGQNSLTMFISSCFNNYSIWFLKIEKYIILFNYASGGIRTRNPWVLRLRNTLAIGCCQKRLRITIVFDWDVYKLKSFSMSIILHVIMCNVSLSCRMPWVERVESTWETAYTDACTSGLWKKILKYTCFRKNEVIFT